MYDRNTCQCRRSGTANSFFQ
ncbi:MAG: hypothetical protein E7294_06870 [Lachnospiraceae bacterium]|nr:hypothetical protein [Lachnospiraceae bacterium]